MSTVEKIMLDCFDARYVSLHVRVTNKAALTLYKDTLGFEIHETEEKYYADQVDAFDMRKYLRPARPPTVQNTTGGGRCGDSRCTHKH
jgi:peptide alpha-N-acetyltransferase